MFQASVKTYEKLKRYQSSYKEIVPPVLAEENAVDRAPIDCARIISQAHHGRVLRAVYRLFLDTSVIDKRHVCWLYGQPNSGKSRFIEAIRKIFSSEEVSWQGSFMPVKERNNADLQV
jgi:phage/plasmid-associated DNA primase